MSVNQVFDLCYIDQWFLYQIKEIVDCELSIKNKSLDTIQSNIKDLKNHLVFLIRDLQIS